MNRYIYRLKVSLSLLVIFLMESTLLCPSSAIAGFDVGRGGDLIWCEGDGFQPGFYSLDYVVTVAPNDNIIEHYNWEQWQATLQARLDDAAPDLGQKFKNFASYLENHSDYSKDRIWLDGPSHLINIRDEDTQPHEIPAACRNPLGVPRLVQAVIRTKGANIVLYHYDQDIVDNLKDQNPLQYSFLMVHEWLWELTQDVRVIRIVNKFLHQKGTFDLTAIQFRTALSRFEIVIDGPIFQDVCERSQEIIAKLEEVLQRKCADITYERLSQWAMPSILVTVDGLEKLGVDLTVTGFSELKPFDFTGLESLFKLKLVNGSMTQIPLATFSPLRSLRDLELAYIPIEMIDLTQFSQLKSLERIAIVHSNLATLPSEIFQNQSALKSMMLNDNKLIQLDPEWVRLLPNLNTLNLDGNRLRQLHHWAFNFNQDLRVLSIASNQLNTLETGLLTPLRKLAQLNLSGNQISTLKNDVFSTNRSLNYLNLSNNNLTALPTGIFENLSELRMLDLSNNNLVEIGNHNFQSYGQMLRIDLSNNQLRYPPVISYTPIQTEVDEINMADNILESSPFGYWRGMHIHHLNLSGNFIKTFSNNPSDYGEIFVEKLDLRNNRIEDLPEEIWTIFRLCSRNSCEIDLRNNPLSASCLQSLAERSRRQTDIIIKYR